MKFTGFCLVALTLALPAFGKGFFAQGKFTGTDARGKAVSLTLAYEHQDGTTTMVAECDFDYACQNAPHVALSGKSYLDFYGFNETYNADSHGSWAVSYGQIGPRRIFYPLFTLTNREPDAPELTLTYQGEAIVMKKAN